MIKKMLIILILFSLIVASPCFCYNQNKVKMIKIKTLPLAVSLFIAMSLYLFLCFRTIIHQTNEHLNSSATVLNIHKESTACLYGNNQQEPEFFAKDRKTIILCLTDFIQSSITKDKSVSEALFYDMVKDIIIKGDFEQLGKEDYHNFKNIYTVNRAKTRSYKDIPKWNITRYVYDKKFFSDATLIQKNNLLSEEIELMLFHKDELEKYKECIFHSELFYKAGYPYIDMIRSFSIFRKTSLAKNGCPKDIKVRDLFDI